MLSLAPYILLLLKHNKSLQLIFWHNQWFWPSKILSYHYIPRLSLEYYTQQYHLFSPHPSAFACFFPFLFPNLFVSVAIFLELLQIFLFWVQDWCFKVLTCCKIYKRYSFTCKAWTVGAFKSGRTTKSQFLWNFFFHHPVGCAGISSCWAYWTITLWLLLVCHKKMNAWYGKNSKP